MIWDAEEKSECRICEGTGIGSSLDSNCSKCRGKGYLESEDFLARKEIAQEERWEQRKEDNA